MVRLIFLLAWMIATLPLFGQQIIDPRLLKQNSATNGQALVWSTANGVWEPGTPSATVGTDAIGLVELDDDANTPVAGDFIIVEVGAGSVDYLTPNAGTDITADLEEETHATEHSSGGADPISLQNLAGAVTDAQVPDNITIDTATALAANPTDCGANQFATAIDASGNLACSAISDADVPDSITISLAATATALAANPTDCSANQFANAIAASGDLTCGSIADADVPDTITVSNYLLLAGGTLTGQLITDNLGIEFGESDTNPTCAAGNYNIFSDLSETNLKKCVNGTITNLDEGIADDETVAGAGLTETGETLDIVTADTSMTINADSIQVRTKTVALDASSSTTSNASGLEISTGLTLLQGCADGESLIWEESTDTWDCGTPAAAGGAPFQDNAVLLQDNADNTKQLRFELSGLTTANTRVLTALDKDYTIEETGHASKHQDGGADEIATTTSAAGAIPKADGSGDIASTWMAADVLLEADVGTGLSVTTNVLNFEPTEVGAVTWLDNADRCWTFDIAVAGTNPQLCFDDSAIYVGVGNFGIDQSNPREQLHVADSTSAGAGVVDLIAIQYGGNISDGGAIVFGNTQAAEHARIVAETPDGGGNTDLYFEVRGNKVFEIRNNTNNELVQFFDGGTKPTCAVGFRHALWFDSGGAGVDDTVEICDKDSADAYAWRNLTGGATPSNLTKQFVAASCQNSVAGLSMNTDSTASTQPAAGCVDGTNTVYGEALYDAATDEFQHERFTLPSSMPSTIDAKFRWRAAVTSGDVVWALQTACVADAEVGDPSWNAAQTVTDTAKGTTVQWNDAQITGVTTTGCAADEEFFFRVYRDADAAGDTMTGDAGLIDIMFVMNY